MGRTDESEIDSAFLKAETKVHFLKIQTNETFIDQIQSNEVLKVKFEVDVDPAVEYESEVQGLLRPVPFSVGVLKPESLFAGKMHALLFRKWKQRVKGRDFYDLVYNLSRGVPINIKYLEEKMHQGGQLEIGKKLNDKDLIQFYKKRIQDVDFEYAKKDVFPFIKDHREVAMWDQKFFLSLAEKIKILE